MTQNPDFSDKVVVVLGASGGLGQGVAQQLAQAGARVVLAGRRQDVLIHHELRIRERGGIAIAERCDATRLADVAALAGAAVAEFGRIDIWINSFGAGALGFFWDLPPEDQARLIDTNLTGVMLGTHVALAQFRRQGAGLLINLGAAGSEAPMAMQATYAATKAAVQSLGRSLNEELRLEGLHPHIAVSTLMPGAVDTPFWSNAINCTGQAPPTAALDDPADLVAAIIAACARPALGTSDFDPTAPPAPQAREHASIPAENPAENPVGNAAVNAAGAKAAQGQSGADPVAAARLPEGSF